MQTLPACVGGACMLEKKIWIIVKGVKNTIHALINYAVNAGSPQSHKEKRVLNDI